MKMANIDSVFDFMFTSSTKDKVSILWLLLVFTNKIVILLYELLMSGLKTCESVSGTSKQDIAHTVEALMLATLQLASTKCSFGLQDNRLHLFCSEIVLHQLFLAYSEYLCVHNYSLLSSYLMNPYSIISCAGYSTGISVTHLFIVCSMWLALRGNLSL